ncbi:MAG: phytase, partial [Acidimicrobiia bacterium]
MSALAVGVIVASLMVGESWLPAVAQTTQVSATVETDPVPSGGDADDPAIWVHPTDPALSIIIGTDKEGGLAVHDLDGNQIQFVSGIQPNNVDIRHGVLLGGQPIDLVVSSD